MVMAGLLRMILGPGRSDSAYHDGIDLSVNTDHPRYGRITVMLVS